MSIFDHQVLYKEMYRIRRFEETVLENFSGGLFFGTTHTYLGQEANAVGILKNLNSNDIVFSNHRSHGHFLAYGGDPRSLFAELMGKATGPCAGRGGSQHLHWRNFYSNGIQGGIVPIATGMALSEKLKGSTCIVTAFLGDGTLGEGVVYEALNMARLWSVPILFVVENNRIAQTTPIELSLSGKIADRFLSFNIPTTELDSSDVLEIHTASKNLISEIREKQIPHTLIINTYRFGPHSKGDDTRPADVINHLKNHFDPIHIHGERLDEKTRQEIEMVVNEEINAAFQSATQDPYPEYKS